jgi:hypothetical protein
VIDLEFFYDESRPTTSSSVNPDIAGLLLPSRFGLIWDLLDRDRSNEAMDPGRGENASGFLRSLD